MDCDSENDSEVEIFYGGSRRGIFNDKGVAGACRWNEVPNMTIDDIEDRVVVLIVRIPSSKTNIGRVITFIDKIEDKVHFSDVVRKYVKWRPENANFGRFFHAMHNGKCVNQVVSINTMGQIPFKIAEYLNLDNPHLYTGHAFTKTLATLLADKGFRRN